MSMKNLIVWLALGLLLSPLRAQSVDGRWTFEKAADFENILQPTPAPSSLKLAIENTQAKLTPNCSVNLRQQAYSLDRPFQALLKLGQEEQAIGAYLSKQFNFRLTGHKSYYIADAGGGCNTVGSDFLVSDDKLIVIRGGVLFYAYKRDADTLQAAAASNAANNKDESTAAVLGGLKASALPFYPDKYSSQCLGNWPKRKGVPQASSKCGPAHSPYVISRNSKEPLLTLIGSHSYAKGGARGAGEDYDNPTSHGLHPIALFLQPLRNVILVRVDDLEGGGDIRDVMSGAYLAIKDGKVTDQLNEGCSFDENYVCSRQREPGKFKLLETGKFVPVN